MSMQPSVALCVADVAASRAFYVDLLGFSVAPMAPVAPEGATADGVDGVCVVDPDGDTLLLAGPTISDPTRYLAPPQVVLPAGATLSFTVDDLDTQHAALQARGVPDVQVAQLVGGERTLMVRDPDGHTLRFLLKPTKRPRGELLALYRRGPDELAAALADLSAEELDHSRQPGEWTIRQIVHHIAEGDALWSLWLKAALASPGVTVEQGFYDPNNGWADKLRYANLAIEPSVALFRANRAHLVELLELLPDAWDQSIQFRWGPGETARPVSAREIVYVQARHVFEHIGEIRTICEEMGQ